MKKYICNKCGQVLGDEKQILHEDFLCIKKQWGYFSKKDGEIHEFCLCENCYDMFTKTFQVPVEVKDATELV